MIRRSLAVLLCLAAPAVSSAQSLAGQWRCSFGNRSLRGLNYQTWQYQFAMALYPNGSFQAQGSYTAMSAGFSVPFQAQGGWRAGPQGVAVRGQAVKQGGPLPFGLDFDHVSARAMSFRARTPGGDISEYCER